MTPDEARLRELRARALAATPGPWETDCRLDDRGEPWIMIGSPTGYDDVCTEDDAAFIAAANPATILALLDALSAERERAEYRIAEAYQVIGVIADAGGLFNHPDVQRALTYFSEAEPQGEILPFSLAAHEAGDEKI